MSQKRDRPQCEPARPPKRLCTQYMNQLREELEKHRIATVDASDPELFHQTLDAMGAAFVRLPEDFDWAKLYSSLGAQTTLTFPKLPEDVKQSLRSGDFDGFCTTWKKKKVSEHGILLKSHAMPVPVQIANANLWRHRDPRTQWIVRYNPIATHAGLFVHKLLPKNLVPADAAVPDDIFKPMAGKDATALHYDGYQGDDSHLERVQMILVNDENAQRHLKVIPNNPVISELIAKITGTSTKLYRGFQSLKLDSCPELRALLLQHAQGITKGIICFRDSTLHLEVDNDDRKEDVLESTFRVYCGYVRNVFERMSTSDRLRLACYRLNGFSLDHFKYVINRECPMFVNSKKCRFDKVRLESHQPLMRKIMGWTPGMMSTDIKKHLRAQPQIMPWIGLKEDDFVDEDDEPLLF